MKTITIRTSRRAFSCKLSLSEIKRRNKTHLLSVCLRLQSKTFKCYTFAFTILVCLPKCVRRTSPGQYLSYLFRVSHTIPLHLNTGFVNIFNGISYMYFLRQLQKDNNIIRISINVLKPTFWALGISKTDISIEKSI